MLAEILASKREQLNILAQAWLTTDTATFSIWNEAKVLAHWPPDRLPGRADLAAPLKVGEEAVGELRVTGFEGPEAQARLNAEAAIIAQLIRQEEDLDGLTAELIESQDQLLALYDLTQTTRSQLDITQLLGPLVSEAIRLIKAEGAFVVLQMSGPEWLVELQPAGLTEHTLLIDFFRQVQSREQELLLSADDPAGLPLSDVTNLFMAPIIVEKRIQAVLGLFLNQPAVSLSPQLKLARAIASFAGAQIENALMHQKILGQTRMQTELELAARIQLQLLPTTPPHLPGLELYASSKPAWQVGGDYYDFVYREGWPCTFAVGDVSGKGMSAAMLMAMMRTAIRSKASALPTPTPEVVIGYSNELMYDDFTEVGMFATLFISRYDPQKRELLYANAGHSPVIYCPAGGFAKLLEADGPAMGVLPISLSEDQPLAFNPGDVLVVATDGFNEASSPQGELFGYTRLLRIVETVAHKSAGEIAGVLFESVRAFSTGHRQDDDQTLLVIKGVAV